MTNRIAICVIVTILVLGVCQMARAQEETEGGAGAASQDASAEGESSEAGEATEDEDAEADESEEMEEAAEEEDEDEEAEEEDEADSEPAELKPPQNLELDMSALGEMDPEKELLGQEVLTEVPTFPGCVLDCRPLGVLHLTEGGRQDHKILAVAVDGGKFGNAGDLDGLPDGLLDEISSFFADHPLLTGTKTDVQGWGDATEARDVIFRAWEGFL